MIPRDRSRVFFAEVDAILKFCIVKEYGGISVAWEMAVVPINWFVKIGFTEGDTERGFRKTVEMSCAKLMSLRSTLHYIYFSGLKWTLRNFIRLSNQKFVVCFRLNFFTFKDKIGVAEDQEKISKSFSI